MQADPVVVRVGDDTQAHVGSGVVQVAQQVHRSAAALRTQQGVQLPTPEQLVGSITAQWSTGREREREGCHELHLVHLRGLPVFSVLT